MTIYVHACGSACFMFSANVSRLTSSSNSINPFQSWEYPLGFLLIKFSINVCLRHSSGSPWHLCSNIVVTLISPQIKLAMFFHLWLASLIIRSFFFFPLSMYLSISSSSNVGNSSAYNVGVYLNIPVYYILCVYTCIHIIRVSDCLPRSIFLSASEGIGWSCVLGGATLLVGDCCCCDGSLSLSWGFWLDFCTFTWGP